MNLSIYSNRRGQSTVLGAILVLGIIILFLSAYQVQVVPIENKQVESDSYMATMDDMKQLRGDITRNARDGGSVTRSITTGTYYKSGIIRINPPPAQGSLETRTIDDGEISISNAVSVNNVNEQGSRSYWDGTTRSYETKEVHFSDGFNQMSSDDIIYSMGTVYIDSERQHSISTTPIVEGNTISLYTVSGNVNANNVRTDVTLTTTSQQRESIIIEGDGEPITITIPTTMEAGLWEESLPDDVMVSQESEETIEMVFPEDEKYELRMAEVILKEESDGTRISGSSSPSYIEGLQSEEFSVNGGTTVQLPVQVRDQFNNPMNGETVIVTDTNNDGRVNIADEEILTLSDGSSTAIVEFDESNDNYTAEIEFEHTNTGNTFIYTVTVLGEEETGGGGGGGTGPGGGGPPGQQ